MGQVIAFPGRNRANHSVAQEPVTADLAQTRVAAGGGSAAKCSDGQTFNDTHGYAMVASFDDLAAIMAGIVCRAPEVYGASETGPADQAQTLAAMAALIRARGDNQTADPWSATPVSSQGADGTTGPVNHPDKLIAWLRRFVMGGPLDDQTAAVLPAMAVPKTTPGTGP